MLLGKTTKYGAGITLSGDYHDLVNLHVTIHYLTDEAVLMPLQHREFVLGLAYEIRHAYEGKRFVNPIKGLHEESTYFATNIPWPDFLLQIAMLRSVASFITTEKSHQADLYRLEACAEEALSMLDANVWRKCYRWLKAFSTLPSDYLISFASSQCYCYIHSSTTAKGRIRILPEIMDNFSEYSEAYRDYEKELNSWAKEKKCKPENLHHFFEDREFRW